MDSFETEAIYSMQVADRVTAMKAYIPTLEETIREEALSISLLLLYPQENINHGVMIKSYSLLISNVLARDYYTQILKYKRDDEYWRLPEQVKDLGSNTLNLCWRLHSIPGTIFNTYCNDGTRGNCYDVDVAINEPSVVDELFVNFMRDAEGYVHHYPYPLPCILHSILHILNKLPIDNPLDHVQYEYRVIGKNLNVHMAEDILNMVGELLTIEVI